MLGTPDSGLSTVRDSNQPLTAVWLSPALPPPTEPGHHLPLPGALPVSLSAPVGTVRVGRTLRCLRHSLQQKSSCCFLMCCSRSPKRPKGGSSGHLGHSCCSSCLGDTKSPPPPTDSQCCHLEQAPPPPHGPSLHASADALEQEPEQALPPGPSMALTFEPDGAGHGVRNCSLPGPMSSKASRWD